MAHQSCKSSRALRSRFELKPRVVNIGVDSWGSGGSSRGSMKACN